MVIGGHWRSTQINLRPVKFIQSYISDGWDRIGLDGWLSQVVRSLRTPLVLINKSIERLGFIQIWLLL